LSCHVQGPGDLLLSSPGGRKGVQDLEHLPPRSQFEILKIPWRARDSHAQAHDDQAELRGELLSPQIPTVTRLTYLVSGESFSQVSVLAQRLLRLSSLSCSLQVEHSRQIANSQGSLDQLYSLPTTIQGVQQTLVRCVDSI
jgi:hypothetical protein